MLYHNRGVSAKPCISPPSLGVLSITNVVNQHHDRRHRSVPFFFLSPRVILRALSLPIMKEIGVDEASIQELEQMGIQRLDAVDCLKVGPVLNPATNVISRKLHFDLTALITLVTSYRPVMATSQGQLNIFGTVI